MTFAEIALKYRLYKNCHNSGTSKDDDMKYGPLSKLRWRNIMRSKKFDYHIKSVTIT